ncbi:type II toxin-antitoxin system HicB family antitoxin [Lysobacter antibioticus]|uniref:type II toxin-antitoxin system HicB family antitoxin n=1 Tax=Lysobacter antibioticus TaxID=84531 RepID=UPI0007170241|nr:type II toxin-antitoxin system HicB family antitoxin [Lysobacter antibioticus]
MTKTNVMKFGNYFATVSYDPEIEMFRGEFVSLNGGADFYAASVRELRAEGQASLDAFLAICKERKISPHKAFSGKLQLRLKKATHERATIAAAARGVSLNNLIEEAVEHELEECA